MCIHIKMLAILLLLTPWGTVGAQDNDESEQAGTTVAVQVPIQVDKGPEDALGRGTPRGSIIGFLKATSDLQFDKAAEYMDLRNLPGDVSEVGGPELDGAVVQDPALAPPLGGADSLRVRPDEIHEGRLVEAHARALPVRADGASLTAKLGRDSQASQYCCQPLVYPLVGVCDRAAIERVILGDDDREGELVHVVDRTTASDPADHGSRMLGGRHVQPALKVAKAQGVR